MAISSSHYKELTPSPTILKNPARLLDFMRQADDTKLINLAAGIPSSEILPFRELEKASQSAFKNWKDKIFAYHVPEGNEELRHLIASRLTKRRAKVSGKDVIITSGCTQALQLMIDAWVNPGDIVACETPAYYGLIELLAAKKARILPLPVHSSSGIDPDLLARELKKWKPKCIVVCTSLSNPSGATIPESQRKDFVEICRRQKVHILEDDIYAELLDAGAPKPLRAFDDGSLVAYVFSFSKTISPGMRIGMTIPGKSFEDVAVLKCCQDIHSSHLSEAILYHFLNGSVYDRHLAHTRSFYQGRRKIVLQAVKEFFPEGTSFHDPKGGFMVWIKLPYKIDLHILKKMALKRQVSFAAGDHFFIQPTSQSHLRLNCAKANEKNLVEGIRRLAKIIKDIKRQEK